tara:strand:- start:253 stop:957 length:705 start_codon:yes stop_codon:yes gene_type:complete
MSNNHNFQSFLFLGPKKMIISVHDELTFEEIYKHEKKIDNDKNEILFEYLQKFLDENILKVEKHLKNFIESLILIIDDDRFLPIEISVKKNNSNHHLTKESLTYSLNEAKDDCKKTHSEKKIIHIIIKNYKIDNKDYPSLPKNIKCDNFSIDIKFICIPNDIYDLLQKVLKKYQISIDRLICSDYVLDFFTQNEHNIFKNTKYLIDGCNENEVIFMNRSPKSMGFFEKFFKIFS